MRHRDTRRQRMILLASRSRNARSNQSSSLPIAHYCLYKSIATMFSCDSGRDSELTVSPKKTLSIFFLFFFLTVNVVYLTLLSKKNMKM